MTGTPTSQNSQTFRVKNSASANTTISANASGSTKYDWVYIKLDATKLNAPNTAGDDAASIFVSRSSSSSADDGTPPTYGYNIAVVTVANGFSTITNGNISDRREQVNLVTGATNTTTGWTATSTPTTITALGNRSYTVLFPSVDITGTVAKGMRLKFTRTVTAPTQCTDLEASSSQYYSKTSPAGMTFTDDFVVSAWVKLESYPATKGQIASRFNGTSGWLFRVDAEGTLTLAGFNAGAGNFSLVKTYQSLPLNKWVHVTAQLDMSTFTATTTTSYVMFDGVDVPASVSRGGTNPTALIQAGNLEIGSMNGGSEFFDGKIAQVAIYSAKVTQATISASKDQTLTGSETSLISAYSFNNTINDLNANANNLTANGSAVATNADTPFTNPVTGTSVTAGATNYAIVTDASFSTNTTLTVQVPEGDTIPTSGGVSAVSYSVQKVPYGFPSQKGKWRVEANYVADLSQSSPVAGTYYNIGASMTFPIGEWDEGYQAPLIVLNGTNSPIGVMSLSTSASALTDNRFTSRTANGVAAASNNTLALMARNNPVSETAAVVKYLIVSSITASATSIQIRATTDTSTAVIYADNAYL